MAFAAIHILEFMVQAVRRAEPALRGAAVALLDGTPPLCKVVAVNATAWQAGMQLGMSKSQAEQFAGVQIRRRAAALEKSTHAALLDLGWSISPRVEDTAPETIVLDLTGLGSIFGADEQIAQEIRDRAARLRILVQVAVAANIDAAVLAARGFAGVTVIPDGKEAAGLGSLPVRALALSEEFSNTLSQWGIRTCAALAALPVAELSERLGQEGVRLHALARGASERALILAEPAVFFEEEMALEDAVEELEPLAFILGRLLDQLCARLDARALAVQSIHTRFELDVHSENSLPTAGPSRKEKRRTRGASRAKAAVEPKREKLYEKTLALPVPLRDSKMLLKLLRLQLQADPPPSPIQKVTLAAEPTAPRTTQEELFLPSAPDAAKLELTLARLANVVGDGNIGAARIVDTHRPGEFRMSHFSAAPEAAAHGSRRTAKKKARAQMPSQLTERTAAIFRAFRPPVAARIDLRAERPVKLFFQGMRGKVLHASGPWRTSGDWWREDSWLHDEWDLEISFESFPAQKEFFSTTDAQGRNIQVAPRTPHLQVLEVRPQAVYRVHYDGLRGSWFVLGVYD